MAALHFLAHPTGYGYIAEIIWIFCCFVMSFVPLCIYLSYIWRYRRGGAMQDELSSKTSMAIELLTTTSMFCFCLALFIRMIYVPLKMINYDNQYVTSPLAAIFRFSWALGESLIHLLFIKRLQYAFKDTNYSTQKRIYHILYILIIIFLIFNLIVVINHILHHFININRTSYMATNFIFTLLFTLIDLIVSSYLVRLFIKKLFIIIVEIDPNMTVQSISTNKIKNKFKLNSEQSSFLNIITKYFILNTIAIISSQFALFFAMFAQIAVISNKNENIYNFFEDIYWLLWILDCSINSLCIYLQLDMSQGIYGRRCRKIHICCSLSCNKFAIKKVGNAATNNYQLFGDNKYQL